MRALLIFHLRSGARAGMRATAPVFAGLAAWSVFQEDPIDFYNSLARGAFARPPAMTDVAPAVVLAFLLPLWGARLTRGLNGWMRHLPISAANNRRGVTVALCCVQLPLLLTLAGGAAIAHAQRLPVAGESLRWLVVLVAGAIANVPATRRWVLRTTGILAALSAMFGNALWVGASIAMLAATDAAAGPIRTAESMPPAPASGPMLHARLAWRALGLHMATAWGIGFAALAAGRLFVHNNTLTEPAARSVLRFTTALAVTLCLFRLLKDLASRRPAWAFARSLPWSSADRVLLDALFLGAHSVPFVLIVLLQDRWAALTTALLLPFLAFRAAGNMRRLADTPHAALEFLFEGLLASATVTLIPWSAAGWLPASLLAFHLSAHSERAQKVTRWTEWQQAHAGDPFQRER